MMEEPISTASTSRLVDVSNLTDILSSGSSKSKTPSLNKPSSQIYLSQLTNYSLSDLFAEPTTLQTQSHHLTSSLTSLTHTSYPTFLSLHSTTTALTKSLDSLSSSLDALLNESLPALEESAAGWKDRTEEVLNERGRARVVLEQHDKIRDLLDIPLLIDACVRNGYFTEALSLAAHAKTLQSSPSLQDKSPPLILQSVLSEVHNSVTHMLLSLLSTLYEPNRKLPALWKAVNFLRKMDAFGPSSPFASSLQSSPKAPVYLSSEDVTEAEDAISSEEQIALAFLLGRESCLKSTLESCGSDVTRLTKDGELDDREKEDLARYLKKYVDVWREGAYDIITQYSTIFLERSSSTASSVPAQPSPTKRNPHQSPLSSVSNQELLRLHSLVTAYASRALTVHLIPILSPALPLLSLSLLPSLLTQLTYCSTAFARVGLDFQGILSLLFAHSILEVVSHDIRTVNSKWVARFQKATGTKESSTSNVNGYSKDRHQPETPSNWITLSADAQPPVPPPEASSSPIVKGPPHIPPQMLASYPPLAEHTNALLDVLNGLRLLAPLDILPDLLLVFDEVLAEGGTVLHKYIKSVFLSPTLNGSLTEEALEKRQRERRIVGALGEVYFSVFIPFIRRALVRGVYGSDLDQVEERQLENARKQWEEWKRAEWDGS